MKVKKKSKLKEKIMITVSIILIIVSVLAVVFVAMWNLKPFDNQEGKEFDPTNNSNFNEDVFVPNEKQINFLVVGVDESELLSDVMLVASFDVDKNSVNILQIPRDSYVSDDTSTGKMNSIYSNKYGDFEELKPVERTIKVIYEQFQIPIDYYAVITLESFRNTVDAIGGIPINLPERIFISYNIILPAGEQILDGEKAEYFVRHRHSYTEGDIGRVKAQRLFLASALQKVKDLGIKKVTTSVIPEVYDQISSNMSIGDMVNFSKMFLNIDMGNINIFMVPGEGTTYNVQSVWAIHADETAQLLNDYFRPYSDEVSADDLQILRIAHSGDWYENTDDNFNDLINGVEPGQKKEDSSINDDSTLENESNN